MACLPFPCFVNELPVDVETKRTALAAVGRCRVYPATCFGTDESKKEEFRAICAKNKEQALVDTETPETKDENKKLKKKYMKQGVAMASKFLEETLKLDVSIIDVQIVLDSKDVIDTDGCLAACFLDAGCSFIVIDGTDNEAMDAAKVPRERIIAHFDGIDVATVDDAMITTALTLSSNISIELPIKTDDDEYDESKVIESVNFFLSYVPEKKDTCSFMLVGLDDKDDVNMDKITSVVAQISKLCKDHKGKIGLTDPTAQRLGLCYAACMRTDRPDGLYTTVVCTRSGEALGLVYSSKESVIAALECGRGVYYSRSRQGLWRKGDTSGHYQTLHRIDVDCDGDALRFTITQRGDDVKAFCHLYTLTCWGEPTGLRHLEETLQERLHSAPEGSYTKRLFDDEELLRNKLVEEAQELSEATDPKDVAGELADVLYFAMVRAAKAGVSIDDAVAELDKRTKKVTRRKGDSKAFRIAAGNEILNKQG